jgi:hypothetical protein
MSIINVTKLVSLMGEPNHYSYTRIKNLLSGLKGKTSKKEIQQVRKLIKDQFSTIDKQLASLENE